MIYEQNSPDAAVSDKNLYQSFRLMKQKDYEGAQALLETGLSAARKNKDAVREGLYLSTLGVLFKLKKDYKRSYRYYQQAERLLKDEASLKIITALLLIEQFNQYETAARKMQKVIETTQDPALLHHALAIQSMAWFKLGKKDKALENLHRILQMDFDALRFAANLDYKMVALFVERGVFLDECRQFLKKALILAQNKKEKVYQKVIGQLLKGIG